MGETYVIYADIFFLINFTLDFFCLYIAGAIVSAKLKTSRLIASSAAGGGWSLLVLYLGWGFSALALPAHLGASLLMCALAYGFGSFRLLIKRTLIFILSAALMGGTLSAVCALSGRYYIYNGGFYARVSPVFLLCLSLFAVAASYVYALIAGKRACVSTTHAVIEKGGETFKVRLLIDSGCFALDMFSGKRVIIVAEKSFGGRKPETPRPIPLKTAGGGERLIYGFSPDKITIRPLGKAGFEIDAVVAVDSYTENFSGFDGLIPKSLI